MAIKKRCARRNMLCAAAVISLFSFFITATALLTGCSSDKDDLLETYTLADDENTMEITFTITVQDNSTTTRATRDDEETSTESTDDTWDDEYTSDDGDTYENTIYNIKVLLLNSSNEIIAEVEEKWTTESSTGVYEFVGALSTSTAENDNCFTVTKDDGDITSAKFDGRIMILANMADGTTFSTTSDGTTIFSEPTYSFSSPSNGGVLSTGIPMFGQKSVSFTLYPGIRTSIDDEIYLLRAMARVELTINNTSSSTNDVYFIGKASIKGYNTSGNIVPSGYYTQASESTSASSVDTEDLSIEGCMNVPTSPGYTRTTETTTDSIVFIKEVEDGDTVCYVYLPEYDYYSDDNNKTTTNTYEPYMDLYIYHRYPVSYTLNETTGEIDTTYATEALGKETLYLRKYSNGVASDTGYDLVRNHIYGYELTKTDDSELYVTTTASDWETVTTYLAWDPDETYIIADGGSVSDPTAGDGDAVYSLVCYPKWTDGSSNKDHYLTSNSQAFASYDISVKAGTEGRQFTWQAFLTNTDYFDFNTNKSDLDDSDGSSNNLDYYTRNVRSGVSRDSLYCIKIGPYTRLQDGNSSGSNYMWDYVKGYENLTDSGKAHCVYISGQKGRYMKSPTETTTTETETGEYEESNNTTVTWTQAEDGSGDTIRTETVVVFTTNTKTTTVTKTTWTYGDTIIAVYTDLFILATSAGGTYAVDVNHENTSEYYVFKPNCFAGGTYSQPVRADADGDGTDEEYLIGENQWIRLWWSCAETRESEGRSYYDIIQKISDADSANGKVTWYDGTRNLSSSD